MLYKKLIFIMLLSLSIIIPASSNNDIKINFLKTANYDEELIKKTIENSNSLAILLNTLNKEFDFKNKIIIEIGDNNGPLYSRKTNKILIPYSFYQEIYNMFKKVDNYKRGISSKEATIDVLMQTILHELAHALIEIYNLPVVGKQEDIADSFAAVILMEFFEKGDEVLLTTSDMFKLYSNTDTLSHKDFINEHTLNIQRFYDSICYIYGSAPLKYENLLENLNYSQDRKLLCKEDYIKNVNSWFRLFKNYFNKNRT